MITENTRKQLADYRKHGKKLKYLINYLMGLIEDKDDFEEIIIREMKALAFNEDEIVECLEYNFGLDMSWHHAYITDLPTQPLTTHLLSGSHTSSESRNIFY